MLVMFNILLFYSWWHSINIGSMVLILDGSSEIGAHVWRDLGVLIRLIHLWRSRAATNLKIFLHTCVTCSELPSNIGINIGSGS